MSNKPETLDLHGDELYRLISAWCDECISDSDLRRLQTVLSTQPEARLKFISYMQIHAGVKTELSSQEHLESFLPLPPPPSMKSDSASAGAGTGSRSASGDRPQLFEFRRWFGNGPARAWAALFLVGALLGGMALLLDSASRSSVPRSAVAQQNSLAANGGAQNSENSDPKTGQADLLPELAKVLEQTPDCQWYFDRNGKVPTDVVRGGDTVRVTSGILKLRFNNETVVTLHAPAIFEVVNDMRARVLLGKVTAKIGPNAKGFSVVTPQATVVDLGTEFGIHVNEVGATDVVVFKGSVDVDYPAMQENPARQQRLQTGEAVHLDPEGTVSRIVSITHADFSDQPQSQLMSPPIITAVHDNIQRDSAWNFYEIVQGGMAEDAKAFVDREAHEWNGVTTAGMPKYLLSGDYVKTFNCDKVKHDIDISVTVSRPCRLYILFDDRIPAPSWLAENFRNTGDKIGVDEGPYFTSGKWRTDHQPGVGPGVSIDNVDSVWVRDVLVPGTIHLGPTETPRSAINMYGIVAVPFDAHPAAEVTKTTSDILATSSHQTATQSTGTQLNNGQSASAQPAVSQPNMPNHRSPAQH